MGGVGTRFALGSAMTTHDEAPFVGARWRIAATVVWSLGPLACGQTSFDEYPGNYSEPTRHSVASCEKAGGAPVPSGASGPSAEKDCDSGRALGVIEGPDCPHEGCSCCVVEKDPVPTGKACGARAGASCSASEYCAYEEGQLCGGADAEATCEPRPTGCGEHYATVCGCDQKTYANSCLANSAGTGVLKTGECEAVSVDEDPSCYSPTKNVAHAYEDNAHGCACDAEKDAAVCVEGVALICQGDAWQAVLDGPCWVP
jgi:hypothetical protein